MKYFITILSFFTFLSIATAQAPQGINFQGVARNADSSPKPAGTTVQIGFKIKDALGADLYTETQSKQTNGVGLFTCVIGQGNPVSGSFSTITWSNGPKFLEVIVDGNSSGQQQIVSVPYALYADKTNLQAGSGISVSGNTINNTGDLSNTNEIQTLSVSGSTLALSNGGGTVTLPAPPVYTPDIAIFEERKQNGIGGGSAINNAFNIRKLNTVVKGSSNVTLDINSGFMTFSNGTYIITASAPAVQSEGHRLCLRTNDDIIKLRGTSELSNDSDATVTRSFIQGVLNVPNDGTVFKLDHYLISNAGGGAALGSATTQVPGQETYAQIVIQKIQ